MNPVVETARTGKMAYVNANSAGRSANRRPSGAWRGAKGGLRAGPAAYPAGEAAQAARGSPPTGPRAYADAAGQYDGAMTADEALDRYRDYRQGEIDSTFIYQALAELEDNPPLADLYRGLAATESRHAEIWQARLRAAGRVPPEAKASFRARGSGLARTAIGPRVRAFLAHRAGGT